MVMFHSYVSLPEGRAQVCFQIQILLGCFGLSKGLTIDVPSVSHFIPFGLPGLTTTPVAPLVHVTRDDFDDHCHLAFQDVSNIYICVCVLPIWLLFMLLLLWFLLLLLLLFWLLSLILLLLLWLLLLLLLLFLLLYCYYVYDCFCYCYCDLYCSVIVLRCVIVIVYHC